MKLSYDEMRTLGMNAFKAAGIAEDIAACVTDALLLAEMDGMPSHGYSRIPFYVDQAKTGKVNVEARPVVERTAPAVITVDACNGYAFPAIEEGLKQAAPLAREYGIMSIPTLMVVRDGKVANQALGARPKSQILQLVD